MFVTRLPVLLGTLAFAPALALAQTPAPAVISSDQVDTSALSYYAANHDTARVDAEVRRLRSLYPNWQPPADPAALAAAPSGVSDDAPLWALFGVDKLDELDVEIAKHKAADPAWNPPDELVAKLASKRARAVLIAASDRKDYPAVLAIAAKSTDLVVPQDLDVSWRVADAYGQSGASDKALRIDQAILDTNADPAARLATVRKAMVSLVPADLDQLMSKGRPTPDGRSEFDAVGIDLVRQRVGRVLAGNAADTAAPADVTRLETAARGTNDAVDAALLGWLYAKRQDWAHANSWFQVALKAGPAPDAARPDDAKVVQGAVIALKADGHPAEAETLAYQWREADPALALLYIGSVQADLTRPKPVALDPERLKRFAAVVGTQQSGDGAQAMGWYAYNIGQFAPAQAWFRKAMAWQPRDSTALGVALSLKQLGDKPTLASFLAENAPTFPALASLTTGRTTSIRTATAETATPAIRSEVSVPRRRRTAVRGRRTGSAPAGCSAGSTGTSGSLQAGWCLMSLDRPQEAAQAFAAARGTANANNDAAYGEALAALRSNRTDEAVAAANGGGLAAGRRSEIGLAALAQTAATAFDEGRYPETIRALDRRGTFTAEPRDLAMLRAWSTYHTGHRDVARTMFSTLDEQMSTSETRAGMAATNQQTRY